MKKETGKAILSVFGKIRIKKERFVKMICSLYIMIIAIVSIIAINASMVCAEQENKIQELENTVFEQNEVIMKQNMMIVKQETKKSVKKQEQHSIGMFEITAYCPCEQCSGQWGTMTSTGTEATAGRTVGVNPDVIPYGSRLIIDGHEYVAEDTGSAMQQNPRVIDVFMDSHEEALQFGRKKIEVFILE